MAVQADNDAQRHGNKGCQYKAGQHRTQAGKDLVNERGCAGIVADFHLRVWGLCQDAFVALLLHDDKLRRPVPLVAVLLPQLPRLLQHIGGAREGPQRCLHLGRGQMPEAEEQRDTDSWQQQLAEGFGQVLAGQLFRQRTEPALA